jgi:hypothetical protein
MVWIACVTPFGMPMADWVPGTLANLRAANLWSIDCPKTYFCPNLLQAFGAQMKCARTMMQTGRKSLNPRGTDPFAEQFRRIVVYCGANAVPNQGHKCLRRNQFTTTETDGNRTDNLWMA